MGLTKPEKILSDGVGCTLTTHRVQSPATDMQKGSGQNLRTCSSEGTAKLATITHMRGQQ